MLTITITLIVLSFSLKYAVVDLINLNNAIIKSLLQNPISEEEEDEEQVDSNTADLFLQLHNDFSLFVFSNKLKYLFSKNCINYTFNLIDLLKLPPESNL